MLGALLLAYLVLLKTKVLRPARLKGITSTAYGGMLTLLFMAIVGIFAAIDFTKLFDAFHAVFFPGKENWVFNESTEQVINILPEEFFAVCAGFIVGVVVILSITLIVVGVVKKVKSDRLAKNECEETAEKRE